MWESRAKGLFTKKLVSADQLAGNFFLLAKWHEKEFTVNVQTAHDAGVACMLFYEADPESVSFDLKNIDGWPEEKVIDLQNIINAVMVGGVDGVPRDVKGVMIDCSKVIQKDGKKITAQWIAGYGDWLLQKVWDLLGIPVYLYMDQNPLIEWKNDPVSIETLYTFIAKWGGVCTVDWANEIDENGYPVNWSVVDKDGAISIVEKPSLTYDDGQPWLFIFYHLDGDGNIDVIHHYVEATLAETLGFSPPAQDPVDESEWDGNEGDDNFEDKGIKQILSMILIEQKKTNVYLENIINL